MAGPKESRKLPAKFPSEEATKNSPTSFCRSAGRIICILRAFLAYVASGAVVPLSRGPSFFLLAPFGILSRTLKSGVPKSEFPGVKKGGTKEVKRGKGVGEGTGPEGERGGKNERKRVGGKGPESTLEKL